MNNTKLRISNNLSLEKLELILSKINNSQESLDLELPIKIDYRGFGILPQLYLIIFTWMRNRCGRLILPIQNDDDIAKKYVFDYYGYVVLSTLWRHCEIVDSTGISLKPLFRNLTSEMHFQLQSLDEKLPHEAIVVPSFDHYSNEKGLPHWFYRYDYLFAKTPDEIENSVYHILSKLAANYKTRLNRTLNDSFDTLNKIIWELLKNTDEHAKKDHLDQVKLMPNTRGLFIKIHRSSKHAFIDGTSHNPLKEYYNKAFENDDSSFILEITVFDSGPGLVKRFLGHQWTNTISISDEIDTIKKCLIKGQTSVHSIDGKTKGYGLDEVLRLLDAKRGFLKIRTGRASIYRDMIKNPYQITREPSEVSLFDWESFSNETFSEMCRAEGTVITLACPLN